MTSNQTFESRDKFYADNSDEALVTAITEALAKTVDAEVRAAWNDDALLDEMVKTLEALLESNEARARLRTHPFEQVELGIASNADDEMHPLFTP